MTAIGLQIKPREAAQLIGTANVQWVYAACESGQLGAAYRKTPGGKRTCIISDGKLAAFLGITRLELAQCITNLREENENAAADAEYCRDRAIAKSFL